MQKSAYKVSVLIPVYKVENYIEKCARSLFNNTIASDCEFIFTNDCTPDSSMEILSAVIKDFPELQDNIKIINHEKNMGISLTRNEGFELACGEYLICTDSDDYVEPDYLEALYTEAKKGDYDLVGCDFYMTPDYNSANTQSEEKIIKRQPLSRNPETCIIDLFEDRISAYAWNKLIKTEVLKKGNIQFVDELYCTEDVPFITELFSYKPSISYLSRPLYNYIKRDTSCTNGRFTLKKTNNVLLMVTYLEKILKNNSMDWAYASYDYLVCRLKYLFLMNGTNLAQKNILNMKKEVNAYADKITIKPFYKGIIKISNFSSSLAYTILHAFFLLKCMLGRIDYKKYIEKKNE
jgi:glycosyltransferase involved in cell wall biosynthesis